MTTSVSVYCDITNVLRLGSKGAEAECLQEKLNNLSDNFNLSLDGSFGPKTETAVMAFQSSHGLVPDGIVGPLSRAALNATVANAIYPAGCTSIVGYSPTTGIKCDNVSNPLPPSLPSLPPAISLSVPVITSLSATTIQNGDKVTVYGKNFTQSNTVLLDPLGFPDQYTHIVSTDGTSIQIIISTPISESLKNTYKDNPQIHQAIIDKIKSVRSGGTDGWYLPAKISVVNENGASNVIEVKINVLNGV